MEEKSQIITKQLKDTCKLTNAKWAVWVERVGSTWLFRIYHGLNQRKLKALEYIVGDTELNTRLSGGLTTGRTRSFNIIRWEADLGCQIAYMFPDQRSQSVLLVGADKLDKKLQGVFRVLAQAGIPQSQTDVSVEHILSGILNDMDAGASYDLHSVLERVLQMLIRYISCDSACIGLRFGDMVSLDAVWPTENQLLGRQVPSDMGVLKEIISERKMVIVDDILSGQPFPLLPEFHKHGGSWLGVPLLVGKRVIGVVCFISEEVNNFNEANARQAAVVSAHMAPAIETSVALAEASRHLEKLALLNELASAASLGVDADEVAAGIVLRLKRIFNTERVTILWLSSDKKNLYEFGESTPGQSPMVISVENSLSGYVAETGLPLRVSDIRDAPRYLELSPKVQSELAVPLKYRGKVIGVLDLEFKRIRCFFSAR